MHLRLALKLFLRDLRGGELTILLGALVIAVSTVTTISLFVDRLEQALLRESASFIAADAAIYSSDPIDQRWVDKASSLGLDDARTISFLSMIFSGDRSQLVSVKGVEEGYPLRGKLSVTSAPFVNGFSTETGPQKGEVWLESRLFSALNIRKGDSVEIGIAKFPITQILSKEPDRGVGFESSAGPRVMMNLADVPSTGVIKPGSRVSYRYLVSGDADTVNQFERWVRPKLEQGARWVSIEDGVEGVGYALNRAESFLLLGGLLGVVLAGLSIALAAQRYAFRHFDHVAILKTLGTTVKGIDSIFIIMILVLCIVGALLGILVGYAVQATIAEILDPLIPVSLPAPSLRGMFLGPLTGLICLCSFALPPLLKLRTIEPLRVIRRDFTGTTIPGLVTYTFAGFGILGLMYWYSENIQLTLFLFSGSIIASFVLLLISYLMLQSGQVIGIRAGSAWRLALSGIQRRARSNALQILVFGLAIMLLLILFLVRTALLTEWKASVPEDAPNHFALNIAPMDVGPLTNLFDENNVRAEPLFSMTRGRVVAINGEPVADKELLVTVKETKSQQNSRGPSFNSNRNLTWANKLPNENRVIDGAWWPPDYIGKPLVSLEASMAIRGGVRLNDMLDFKIQDQIISAQVASIRSVSWDSMQPNFYFIFSPGAISQFSSTYMTSFFLEKKNKGFLNVLLRSYPTITLIEIDAVLDQITSIIENVTLAIELVLILILVSGAFVLIASIQASMDARYRQSTILRALGASQKLILFSLFIEFAFIGILSGIVATLGAEITVFVLQSRVFELDYSPYLILWALGPLSGLAIISILGLLATRKVIFTPPSDALRG